MWLGDINKETLSEAHLFAFLYIGLYKSIILSKVSIILFLNKKYKLNQLINQSFLT